METHYINTDLDLISERPFDELSVALEAGSMGWVNNWKDDQGLFRSGWELQGVNLDSDTPEQTIRAILNVLETLPEPARTRFLECREKHFDIGYTCGTEPWGFQQEISCPTLTRISALGASLRLTLYPETPPGHKKKKGT